MSWLQSEKDRQAAAAYKTRPAFSKRDLLVLAATTAVALLVFFLYFFLSATGNYAEIYHDGESIGEYRLSRDNTVVIHHDDHVITIFIENGSVWIAENDCPNQICVKTGKIAKTNERIVCAPYRITVVIRSRGKSAVDGVTGGVG